MKKYLRFYQDCMKSSFLIWMVGAFFVLSNSSVLPAIKQKKILNPLERIKLQEPAIRNNPYSQKKASIRFGNDLCEGELNYLNNRKPKIGLALKKILDISLENTYVPTVAMVCSGGGYRAMFGTIGSFSGFKQIGLLDTVTYISSLSGSTWALAVWMSTGMTIPQLKNYIAQNIARDFYHIKKPNSRWIGHMLACKLAFKQPISTIDLFGSFVANHLLSGYFDNKSQMVHLSDQVEHIKNGNVPFPIYTAVDGRTTMVNKTPWYEFTPFEIGSAEYAAYVPAWAFGRTFDKGISVDDAPEQSLGYLFGIFGSAFGAHVGLAWDRVIKDLLPLGIGLVLEKFLVKTGIINLRVIWAKVRNFMFGIDGYDLTKHNNIKLIDAGIACNLPYVPVSGQREQRKADILILCDFSQMIPHSLREVEAYACKKGLKFPKINYDGIENNTISIFKDENDIDTPMVIYMPCISDMHLWQEKKQESRYKKYHRINEFDMRKSISEGHCYTTNFQYTSEQSKQLMDLMEFNVVVNEQQIMDAIRWVVEEKSHMHENRISESV